MLGPPFPCAKHYFLVDQIGEFSTASLGDVMKTGRLKRECRGWAAAGAVAKAPADSYHGKRSSRAKNWAKLFY
jgi:hypothetical protein